MEQKQSSFASALVEWGKHGLNRYAWRRTSDPYRILIAEILLRKTTREQVEQVFPDFIRNFPTVEALSTARTEDIRKTVRSLGLENIRASGLSRLAKAIVKRHHGKIPADKDQLIELPSVGQYTSNAVLCMAYKQHLPLVDTNVIRIMTRVFSIKSRKRRPHTDPKLWDLVASLIPSGKARSFNIALLDLGRSLCLPQNPKCSECPLVSVCDYGRGRKLTKRSSS